jgi:hypothetical protein
VYRNGAKLGTADFTATNGTTVVLASGASSGDLVTTVSFYVSSVLNAIPNTTGSVLSSNIASGVTINFADGSASTPSITNDGDTNTGIFFPAADTIAFSEGGTEQMRLDSAGNLQMNSGYGSVAIAYGCRAWVNFQANSTVTIRASGNVSSVTDNGVGEYTVNLTTAMPDVNYSYQICARDENNGMGVPTVQADPTRSVTTTALPIIYNYPFNQLFYDADTITVAVFR